MQVTVGNQLRIENPSEQLLTWCKKQLILPNPEYAKKVRMHFWVGNTPEKLYLFQWDGDTLVLPYGCLNDVLAMGDCHTKVDLPIPTEVDFGCTIPLYDYQVEAKEALITAYYGILQAPAGCGKTQIGIAVAADTGRRTLWLTHTRDLLVQSKSRAEQYMSPSLTGTITEGRVQIGKAITFATVQTMCNLDLSQYRDVWDCIIVDECHRVAGTPTAMTQFSKVLNALAARHKYGLSATVHRADGMIVATYALLGGIAYQVPEEAVKDKIMTVSVLPRATHQGLSREFLDTDGTIIYAKLVNFLADRYGKLDEETIKQLTGGEEIKARNLYETATTFLPQFTLWLSCNDLPTVSDKSLTLDSTIASCKALTSGSKRFQISLATSNCDLSSRIALKSHSALNKRTYSSSEQAAAQYSSLSSGEIAI